MYDVVVIGGGIIGACIARDLSRYQLKTLVVEKEAEIGSGTTKANSAIVHAGYDCKPGTLKAKLNVEGNAMYDQFCKDLDVPFKRSSSIVVAMSEEDMETIKELYERGTKNGVPKLKIIHQDELRKLEPNISENAVGALYAGSGAIVCPFNAAVSAAENAYNNGVEFKLETEVTSIEVAGPLKFIVNTNNGKFETKYVVNAAGVYADKINDMVGGEPYKITPRRGEYCILDKEQVYLANTVIFPCPTKMGKGILVAPTVEGNLLIGPNAQNIDDKEDLNTTAQGLNEVIEGAKKSVPHFLLSKIITSFSGLRATGNKGDFIIEESKAVPGFVNVGAIESPGLSSAPAIGKFVTEILKESGLEMKENPSFEPTVKPIPRFREMSLAEKAKIVKENPSYGRIICRCETVTEGEIVEAVRRPLGPRTIDGVKRRCRAGLGRCQGGFCSPRVGEIISRETGIPLLEVTKFGRGSIILDKKMKESAL